MSLNHDDVARIARLARIALPAGEADDVLRQLNRVLGLVDQLQAVETTDVSPMAHALDARDGDAPEPGQRLRPDVVTETDQRDAFQSCAPSVAEGLYLVPKVIE